MKLAVIATIKEKRFPIETGIESNSEFR